MLLSLGLFRLRIGVPGLNTPARSNEAAEARSAAERKQVVQRPRVAFALVLAAALLAAPADFAMQRFEVLAQDLGPPRLAQFTTKTLPQMDGWSATKLAEYPWIVRYFGQDATWDRYQYLQYRHPYITPAVTLDVISTSDLNTFSTYGLQACYRFHNYRINEERRVDLGNGITAHAMSYYIPSDRTTWSAVYWEWPVNPTQGRKQKYERIILNRVDFGKIPVAEVHKTDLLTSIGLAISDAFTGSRSERPDTAAAKRLDDLIGFSRHVVSGAASHATAPSQATAPSR
jgi:hypothetical protein